MLHMKLEVRNAFAILVENPFRNWPLWRLRSALSSNIKINFRLCERELYYSCWGCSALRGLLRKGCWIFGFHNSRKFHDQLSDWGTLHHGIKLVLCRWREEDFSETWGYYEFSLLVAVVNGQVKHFDREVWSLNLVSDNLEAVTVFVCSEVISMLWVNIEQEELTVKLSFTLKCRSVLLRLLLWLH
jgi:hypothetical protein